jgi:hypothetical protein
VEGPGISTVTFFLGDYAADPVFESTQVENGLCVSEPLEEPLRRNYWFLYWAYDENGDEFFDFDTPIDDDLVLYAVWAYMWELDAPASWAYNGVVSAMSNGLIPFDLFVGFNSNCTRLDFCRTAIQYIVAVTGAEIGVHMASAAENGYLLEGVEFSDTDHEDVLAAAALGIVNGKPGGIFDPGGEISRVEAAAMLSRTLDSLGYRDRDDVPQTAYADQSAIVGSWARDAVNFMAYTGIMTGTGDGTTFTPYGKYTIETSIVTFARMFDWGGVG